MGDLVLYVACSLDGYIADSDGRVDFLDAAGDANVGYDAFYNRVGSLIMGGATYRQITRELSPDVWPYPGKPCYVYTRGTLSADAPATATQLPPAQLLQQLRTSTHGDIWLVGGGQMINLFLQNNLIDRYLLFTVPVLLGGGMPLFPSPFFPVELQLESSSETGGVVVTTYRKKKS